MTCRAARSDNVCADRPRREPFARPAVGAPFSFGNDLRAPNRVCIQPMEGRDAEPDGAPGERSRRRYQAFAAGGAGMIWTEALAISPRARSSHRQLCLHEDVLERFETFTEAIRDTARRQHGGEVVLIAQLTHPGRFSRGPEGAMPMLRERVFPDPETPREAPDFAGSLDAEAWRRVGRQFLDAAVLASRAGFDGIDIKCSHRDLLADLLRAPEGPAARGTPLETRARLLLEIFEALQPRLPRRLPALRLGIALPGDVASGDGLAPPEALRLIHLLFSRGLRLLNPHFAPPDAATDPEVVMAEALRFCRSVKNAFPELALVAGGFSAGLANRLPEAARQTLAEGTADFFGLGRAALADPSVPAALAGGKPPDPARVCLNCGACDELLKLDRPVGCAARNPGRYADDFLGMRRLSRERLREASERCRDCPSADCSAACPGGMDPRGFVSAFARGELDRAYAIARADNPLPELSAWLCPAWMYCEKSCVENFIGPGALPVRDIQRWLGRWGKIRGRTGVRAPETSTGKRAAVVGAGPAGLAAAAALVKAGHEAVLYERTFRLGGIPALAIPTARLPDEVLEEIDVLLAPAIARGRLRISCGRELGRNLALNRLRTRFDAVLLATGPGRERALFPGSAERVDALSFLESARNGALPSIPESVAVVCGGDCAMDAAATVLAHGAKRLYLVYEGPLSEMLWHASAEEFRRPGTSVFPHCRVLRRDTAPEGGYAVRLRGPVLSPAEAPAGLSPVSGVPGEWMLRVGLLIEATGLEMDAGIRAELTAARLHPESEEPRFPDGFSPPERDPASNIFAAGALVNGGASVVQCLREGIEAANTIHRFLIS